MNRRVDQKIYFAKLTLAAIATNAVAQTALIEAALFHLHVAYLAYLRELLDALQYEHDADNACAARELLIAHAASSADIDELAKLEQSGEWPAQLQRAHTAAINITSAPASPVSANIALHDVTEQVDAKILMTWLQQFEALLQRQRTHAQEW